MSYYAHGFDGFHEKFLLYLQFFFIILLDSLWIVCVWGVC